jgi:hypothetical protein
MGRCQGLDPFFPGNDFNGFRGFYSKGFYNGFHLNTPEGMVSGFIPGFW